MVSYKNFNVVEKIGIKSKNYTLLAAIGLCNKTQRCITINIKHSPNVFKGNDFMENFIFKLKCRNISDQAIIQMKYIYK